MKKSDRNKEVTYFESKMSLEENIQYLNEKLAVDANFDVVYRVIEIGGKRACMYFVDGFCKDDLMQKMLQYFISIAPKDMPQSAHEMWRWIYRMNGRKSYILFFRACLRCLLTDMTSAFSLIPEPILQETYQSRKRIRY